MQYTLLAKENLMQICIKKSRRVKTMSDILAWKEENIKNYLENITL
jgi:hypothetical protein